MVLDERLYEEQDFPTFALYCEDVGVSPSFAYDLVRISRLAPTVKAKLEELGPSKSQLALRRMDGLTVEKQIEVVQDIGRMTWHEAASANENNWHLMECPICGGTLSASRKVTLKASKRGTKRQASKDH